MGITSTTTNSLKGVLCDFCEGNDFKEHESGFYVCSDCGVMTNINHSTTLEYNNIHNERAKMKFKAKNFLKKQYLLSKTNLG